ncbi:hypothetical protein FGIG_06218 [Fasciola gigantica]|uniref:Uncharacterized protein n=1 Tax=Fasciola gigantica TaxID=46835 RepID=A0A504YVU1_FASGI|nr:hypothetical protein FGIG_06218 [Fasciola gigantica]
MFVLPTLHLFAICLLWINVEGTEIKMMLWELKTKLEEFVLTTNQHITDFGNLLATKDKQICKELWKKFEDAATSLNAEVVQYSLFERISSLAISLTKAIQANGYIIRLLDSAKVNGFHLYCPIECGALENK